ncbi:hypothetical protein BDR06DRAFT_1040253 [Suillus hirtellus]|nr:hypothetical protein BDR06DRAFT_1040253 [Suillus hirtellus]
MPDFVPAWSAAYQKAKNFILDYTIEEKVNITTGNSPLAIFFVDYVTAFPAGIQVASMQVIFEFTNFTCLISITAGIVHPFLCSIMASVSTVMCSYNLINESYTCNNDKMLNDILKQEYSVQSFVQSDWSVMMSTLSAVAGLDMTMLANIPHCCSPSSHLLLLLAVIPHCCLPLSPPVLDPHYHNRSLDTFVMHGNWEEQPFCLFFWFGLGLDHKKTKPDHRELFSMVRFWVQTFGRTKPMVQFSVLI